MLVDPADETPEDPAVEYDEEGTLQSVDWENVRNDTLRELYFEGGRAGNPAISTAAAAEAVRRVGAGTVTRDDVDGIDLGDAQSGT